MNTIYKQNTLKKCFFLLFGITLLIGMCLPFSSAYTIKYYGKEKVNVSFMDKIPAKYFDGVRVIRIYEKCNTLYEGYYHLNGFIDIFCGDDKITLIHELSHHKQFLNKEQINHNQQFYKYEMEIWNETI